MFELHYQKSNLISVEKFTIYSCIVINNALTNYCYCYSTTTIYDL